MLGVVGRCERVETEFFATTTTEGLFAREWDGKWVRGGRVGDNVGFRNRGGGIFFFFFFFFFLISKGVFYLWLASSLF